MTIVERFGRNVSAARKFVQISQSDLAREAGIDPSYVSLIESGKREVGIETAGRIAAALQVSLGHLLTGQPFTGEGEKP